MTLLTLAEAKDHLRITTPDDDPGDAALTQQITFAEALVLDYVGRSLYWRDIAATWTAATLPEVVRWAMLLQLGEAYRFRGDDVEGEGPARLEGVDLAPRVAELLRGYHDPVVA